MDHSEHLTSDLRHRAGEGHYSFFFLKHLSCSLISDSQYSVALQQWITLNDSARSFLLMIHTNNYRNEDNCSRGTLTPVDTEGLTWLPGLLRSCISLHVSFYTCVLFVCANGSGLNQLQSGLCFLPSGLDLRCACVHAADHLFGSVANFSIRRTHSIFSVCPKGQALFIDYCVQSQWVTAPLQADVDRP